MRRVHAFVAEAAANFIDLVVPAGDEALEVRFRRDAQVKRDVQRVVVREERLGARAGRLGLEDRRIDLEEALAVEELAHHARDPRPEQEALARILVHDEVEVTPAIARLHIAQAVPFFGQRPERLAEKRVVGHVDGQLSGLRADEFAAHADEVADIEVLDEPLVLFLADFLFGERNLDFAADVLYVREGQFAYDAYEEESAGGGQRLSSERRGQRLGDGVSALEALRVRVDAGGFYRLEFLQPHFALVVYLRSPWIGHVCSFLFTTENTEDTEQTYSKILYQISLRPLRLCG